MHHSPAMQQLRSPKGKPMALSPLLMHATPTSPSIGLNAPLLSLLPEPFYDEKLTRTVSGASTTAPVDEHFARTTSAGSSTVAVEHDDGLLRTTSVTARTYCSWGLTSEALRDGPALTLDGRAVDLEGGNVIHFSHERDLTQGEQRKRALKDGTRRRRAAKRAQAALEAQARVDTGEVCPMDAEGVLHGCLPPAKQAPTEAISRSKHFRRRQIRRQRRSAPGPTSSSMACAGPDGKVFLYLKPALSEEQQYRLERKQQLAGSRCMKVVERVWESALAIDAGGLVHFE